MANNLEFWDRKLHLEKIRELMKVMLVNNNNFGENVELKDIKIGEKTFNTSIKDAVLNIKCSDGRNLYISLYSKAPGVSHVQPQITYMFGQDRLNITGDVFKNNYVDFDGLCDGHFIEFDDFYNDDQLIRKLEFYTKKGTRSVRFRFNGISNFLYTICYSEFGDNRYFKIDDKCSVVYGDGVNFECRVSFDLKKIISYNGIKLPSLEEIRSFDFKEQIQKVKDLLNKYGKSINSFTLDYLNENLDDLEEKQELRDEYIKLYEYELPICREAIQKRNEFLNNLNVYIFTEDELASIIGLLKEAITANINKENEKILVKVKSRFHK